MGPLDACGPNVTYQFSTTGNKQGAYMQCEKCSSENTQRLQVAFEGGTQDINARSHTASVGSLSGALGLSGAITKTTGTSQSMLAQKASPPQKRSLKGSAIAIIIGLFCLSGSGGTVAIGLLLMAAGGYFGYTAMQFNNNQWPGMYQIWLESWICHKCGHIYHQA